MTRRHNDNGQTLPLVSLCIVTLLVAAALSVDIGSLAVTNRRLQGIADLAAIDGARELTGGACNAPIDSTPGAPSQQAQVTAMAVASAGRNDFVIGGDKTLIVELGTLTTRDGSGKTDFVPLPSCTASNFPEAVRVQAGDRTAFSFGTVIGQSGRTSSRDGFASRGDALEGEGAFSLGSAVATIDTTRSTLLNPILNQMLCPGTCSGSLGVASYQGLVDSDITFGRLATQLGFGTTSELFSADVTVDRILEASALLVDPTTVAAVTTRTQLSSFTTAVTGNALVKLGDLVSADLLTGDEAADVGLNLFQLVTGTAAIANGTNLVSVPNLGITVPGVTSIGVRFNLIEAPVIIGTTPGATRTTKQLSLTLTPQISLSSGSLLGLSLTSITGALSIGVTGGKATGTLTGVRCGADKGIDVNVVPTAATTTTTGSLTVSLSTGGLNSGVLSSLGGLLNPIVSTTTTGTFTVSGAGASSATPPGGFDRTFDFPDDFGPDGSLHVGNTTVGMANIVYSDGANLAVDVTTRLLVVNTVNRLNLSVPGSGVAALLQPVTSQIDTQVVQPLMHALGLDLGGADIMANSLTCGVPRLG